jgi:diguanylate cyclase (GGDEF)-like protein
MDAQSLFAMLERTPLLVAVYDSFDRLRFANDAFCATFFVDRGENVTWAEIVRRNYRLGRASVISTDNFEQWLTSAQSRRGKVPFRAFETDLLDGRWLWMTETVFDNGWMLSVASDITNLQPGERAMREQLQVALRAANTDDLTGVGNRRYLLGQIKRALEQGKASNGLVGSLCILDIDHFKAINDRYGHQTGDLMLCRLATVLQEQLRRADVLGRVGGEEFAIFFPRTSGNEAVLLVERMLAVIRNLRPIPAKPDARCTFSAGIAETRRGDIVYDLYSRADAALYAAKLSGRNRIHLHEEHPGLAVGQ